MSVPPDQLDRQAAYQAALAASTGSTGGWVHPTMTAPPPPPPPYPGYMSPQDLLAAATKAIQDAYAPQLAYLQQQQQSQQQRNAAQQSGLVELYKLLAGSMSGLGGQISDIYNQGASDIGNYAQGVVSNDLPLEQQIVSSGAAQGPGYGSAYPQLAGQQGQVEFLKAVQDANAQEQDMASQIQALVAQEPGKVQELLSQLQGQQADYAKAAQPIIRSAGGNVIAIDPTTGKVQVLYQGATGSGKTTIRQLANGQLQAFDSSGRPVGKPYGPTKAVTTTHHYTATGGGDILDTTTGEVVGRVTTKPAGAGKPYRFEATDGRTYELGPDGKARLVPGQPGPKAGTSKTPSPATLAQARRLLTGVGRGYVSQNDPNTPLSSSELRGVVKDYNEQARRQNHTEITIADLGKMSPDQLAILGLNKFGPQQAYLGMVALGIPARQAWKMVRKKYPSWGEGYFSGKADAAATGGTGASYNPQAARRNTQPIQREAWPSMIQAAASTYGLDPAAVLAVAQAEGLGGGVGDSGTSFGPFQLHIGGALPRGKDQSWAESPAGIDYALRKIASVARGKTGRAAVESIVRLFERPADPEGEIARALAYYENWATV